MRRLSSAFLLTILLGSSVMAAPVIERAVNQACSQNDYVLQLEPARTEKRVRAID